MEWLFGKKKAKNSVEGFDDKKHEEWKKGVEEQAIKHSQLEESEEQIRAEDEGDGYNRRDN